jgi:hypothetical protein
MANPSDDFKDALVDNGVGVFAAQTGWGIFIGRTPGEFPVQAITIFDTPVREPLHPINAPRGEAGYSKAVEYSGVLIRIHAPGYKDAYNKGAEIVKKLFNFPNFVANGFRYMGFYQQSDLTHIGEDDRSRNIFTLNYMAIRTPE